MGRKITENLTLLRNTIAYVQYWGMDICLISLDQEKAFDRTLHTHMLVVLSKMGFGSDYLKVLGIWFRGATVCAKTWEECTTKAKQKLGRWEHRSLSIEGKNLVI
eukprot:g31042.t1